MQINPGKPQLGFQGLSQHIFLSINYVPGAVCTVGDRGYKNENYTIVNFQEPKYQNKQFLKMLQLLLRQLMRHMPGVIRN